MNLTVCIYVGIHNCICRPSQLYMSAFTTVYVGIHNCICRHSQRYMSAFTTVYVGIHNGICRLSIHNSTGLKNWEDTSKKHLEFTLSRDSNTFTANDIFLKCFSQAILIIYLNVIVTYNYIYMSTPCYPSTPNFVIWIDIIIHTVICYITLLLLLRP